MSALRWMIIFASHAQKFGDLVYAVIHILKKFVEDFLVAVHGAGYMCVKERFRLTPRRRRLHSFISLVSTLRNVTSEWVDKCIVGTAGHQNVPKCKCIVSACCATTKRLQMHRKCMLRNHKALWLDSCADQRELQRVRLVDRRYICLESVILTHVFFFFFFW